MTDKQQERDNRFDHIIFFDMDNVLVDFKSGLDRVSPEIKAEYDDDGTGKPHYDDIPGLFSLMDPMPGAIEAVKALAALGKYAHYSLGLFLAQYLCNGFNLADAAHLTYNEHYFISGRQSFQFIRQKTEERSEVEVVIPIIPALQVILDEIAAPPVKGTLVFPEIYGDAQTPEQKKRRVAMENQNIKKRVRRLVESFGWSVQPSGTWCRHSFATNLTHAGVPHNYISESMGHAVDNNITNRYIDAYPLSQQMAFNSKLLKLNDEPDIMEELKDLTPEQLKALIAMVKNA